MKYSLSSSFARQTLVLIVTVLGITLIGRYISINGAAESCATWPVCIPTSLDGWINILHRFMAALAALLMILIFRKAWREQRDEHILLPLTTVTALLFFGQIYVGAMQVFKGFPKDLVVLHTVTAIALWVSLAGLMFVSGVQAQERTPAPISDGRQRWKDFLALNKPWIVGLLLVTTYAGLVVGGKAWPSLSLAFWTMLGGALAAGGSSALNQYIDRELDKNMQRTAKRPLAASRLTPAEGLAFGLALCLASYYILATMVNFLAALLSLAGILYYVILYSLWLKKATVQNIVIGGGAGAIPPMVGWAAATGELSLAAWILFAIVFMWTPPHFWALAIVRRSDYERAGVPMLPVVRGELETRRQILIYTFELVAVTLLLPVLHLAGTVYLVSAILLGLSLIFTAWRVWKIPGNKPAWTMYRWSSMYLAFIFLALVLDAVIRPGGSPR
jgi:protoheme IX farnesyltransferase